MALEQWAKSQAERYMAPLGDRWLHVQAVADKARRVSTVVPSRDREVLVAAAYLHDIGYAPELNRLGFHPLDGARYLRRHGQERLACLVAHHSGAWFEAEERGLLEELAAFAIEDGPVMDALTFADMTPGPLASLSRWQSASARSNAATCPTIQCTAPSAMRVRCSKPRLIGPCSGSATRRVSRCRGHSGAVGSDRSEAASTGGC